MTGVDFMFFLETKPSESCLDDIMESTTKCCQSWLRHWLCQSWCCTGSVGNLPTFRPFWLVHTFAWFYKTLYIWDYVVIVFTTPFFPFFFILCQTNVFYLSFFWLDIILPITISLTETRLQWNNRWFLVKKLIPDQLWNFFQKLW